MNLWGGIPDGYCVALVRGTGPAELLGRLRAGLVAETTLSFSAMLGEAPRYGNSSLIGVAEIPGSFWDAGPEWVCAFEPDSAVISAKAASLAVRGAEIYAVAYRPGELYHFVWALERKIRIRIDLLTASVLDGDPDLVAALRRPSEASDFEAAAAPFLREGLQAVGVVPGSGQAAQDDAGLALLAHETGMRITAKFMTSALFLCGTLKRTK
ncbi:MAG TPA: DUF6461 domain-containing protein [Streptosporangiaceae bacterium]|nr:DUF6461 domain-containing protein [Streptosporangiaceae bacterium]